MQAVSFAQCCPAEYISFFYFSLFLLFDFCGWLAYCGQGVEAGLLRNLEGPSSEAHHFGNRTPFFQTMATPSFSLPSIPFPFSLSLSPPTHFSSSSLSLFFLLFHCFHHLLPSHHMPFEHGTAPSHL